jgi:hypothetical protein
MPCSNRRYSRHDQDQPAVDGSQCSRRAGRFAMWSTRDVAPSTPPDVMMRMVRRTAIGAPGGSLRCLIINCHGIYKGLSGGPQVGGYGLSLGTGFFRRNVSVWNLLKKIDGSPLVPNIMIVACGTARVSPLDYRRDGDGKAFCGEIAQQSGVIVTAGTTIQLNPYGQQTPYYISDWEGLVHQFDPATGRIAWSKDYGLSLEQRLRFGTN